MNIKMKSITDNNDLENERIIFSVIEDDLLGEYIVLKTKKTGEKIVSSKIDATYWFPDKDVKKGDLVVLYTKKGINTEKKNEDGTITYFYYWQMADVLLKNPEDAVVLSRLESRDFKAVDDK